MYVESRKMVQMILSEEQAQNQRTKVWTLSGERGSDGMNWQIGNDTYTYTVDSMYTTDN